LNRVARAFARVIMFVRMHCYGSWFGLWEKYKMDFQVNDQTYFLSLAEDDKRWQVFVSTPSGALSIPVYVDAPAAGPMVMLQEEKHRIPN
jgi:hypothetical protein